MRKYFAVAIIAAFMAVGLSLAVMQGQAAFQTISSGMVNNAGLQQFFRDVRGHKMVAAVAGTADADATTTITGMEAGDVILDVINMTAGVTTMVNEDETLYTSAAGGATHDTGTGLPTAADSLIFFFADIDNSN
jgi:hypothetical protein